MINKMEIVIRIVMGNLYKIKFWFHILFNIKPCISNKVADNVIVSLTSYKRRVSRCAPYTVFSMLTQSICPEKIVLWLDKEMWSEGTIPFTLRQMQKWGIFEIAYCEDVKSFTKLLPALKKYPKKAIITIDDDIYYPKYLVNTLYQSYLHLPHIIHAASTSIEDIILNDENNNDIIFYPHFQYGFGGVLYPPNALSEHVFEDNLYMKLCPNTDDLWFYIMAVINNTSVHTVERVGYYGYTDLLYQKMNPGNRIYDLIKYDNLLILKSLMVYFKIIPQSCNIKHK